MSAHSDLRIFAERNHDAPLLEQCSERFANCGARLDSNGAHLSVVVDALHRGDIDDHAHIGIGYKILEAMSAARYDETSSFAHCFFDCRYHIFSRADEPHVIRTRDESFIEAL